MSVVRVDSGEAGVEANTDAVVGGPVVFISVADGPVVGGPDVAGPVGVVRQ